MDSNAITDRVTYPDLVQRFGGKHAVDLLRCLENLAEIKDDITNIDRDTRLKQALDALNKINFSLRHI